MQPLTGERGADPQRLPATGCLVLIQQIEDCGGLGALLGSPEGLCKVKSIHNCDVNMLMCADDQQFLERKASP